MWRSKTCPIGIASWCPETFASMPVFTFSNDPVTSIKFLPAFYSIRNRFSQTGRFQTFPVSPFINQAQHLDAGVHVMHVIWHYRHDDVDTKTPAGPPLVCMSFACFPSYFDSCEGIGVTFSYRMCACLAP